MLTSITFRTCSTLRLNGVRYMGKGISLEELNLMNKSKKAVQPVWRPRKSPAVKSEAKNIGRQQLAQFEREHFRPLGQQTSSLLMLFLQYLFIGILRIWCLFIFFFVSWETFQFNRGSFYFWAYVFVVPFMIVIGGASDHNWKILGLIVFIIGWFYWAGKFVSGIWIYNY